MSYRRQIQTTEIMRNKKAYLAVNGKLDKQSHVANGMCLGSYSFPDRNVPTEWSARGKERTTHLIFLRSIAIYEVIEKSAIVSTGFDCRACSACQCI
uniref:Bm13068 n=1 Tax=Brugia malayi TaxID=6279 RepID=A0A1I9G1P6_BRUMA|nr:Bm13068 [Brugia malayi]